MCCIKISRWAGSGLAFHLLRVESFSEYLRIGFHCAFYGHAQLLYGGDHTVMYRSDR